jgi:hypothetical protein
VLRILKLTDKYIINYNYIVLIQIYRIDFRDETVLRNPDNLLRYAELLQFYKKRTVSEKNAKTGKKILCQ